MPASPDRALAEAQAGLLAALSGGAAAPPGFALDRVAAMAEVLARKRLRAVRRVAPGLQLELGNDLAPLFSGYAHAMPSTSEDAGDDALAFIEWLVARRPSDSGLYRELLRLRCRRGWPIAMIWLQRERHLAVAWRGPGGHVRCLSLG